MPVAQDCNRRRSIRVPVSFFVDEYIDDSPSRARAVNLSCSGIYLQKLIRPIGRNDSTVALEFALPGEEEPIWARGVVVHDTLDSYLHGTGIRFAELARRDTERIHEYVVQSRSELLEKLILRIRKNRRVPSRIL
jgi:hypothetical protein